MAETHPNILVIMTDEERYPPPYEQESLAGFRRTELPARQFLRERSVELHRHYAGSTACLPSRATLFTGQYPSLHGVTNTDGMAKRANDPSMSWLDPDTVPTLGDWFRAGGYRTHYRGKWHISHADLPIAGTDQSLATNDDDGVVIPEAVDAYRRADRLDRFGFSGWIGREPHGAARADCGIIKDGTYAEQVSELFGQLSGSRRDGPWLAVASFVNPHDIAFSGFGWEQILRFGPPDDAVPFIAEAPSQADSFDGRPRAHRLFTETWPKMLYEQAVDETYRRLYYHLIRQVDRAISRILEALAASGMADDTIIVFTSDHGDLLGAHGGMPQKWHNAYDEAVRVPLLVSGPGVDRRPEGIWSPTSHVDLVPTLLGLAGIDLDAAADGVAAHHVGAQPLPGRDLSAFLGGRSQAPSPQGAIYFMTEDEVSSGASQTNMFSGAPYEAVGEPAKVESVITELATGPEGGRELWKLNHYYERLDEWNVSHGIPANPFAGAAAGADWELYNLSLDPEERTNLATSAGTPISGLRSELDAQREAKRKLPALGGRRG